MVDSFRHAGQPLCPHPSAVAGLVVLSLLGLLALFAPVIAPYDPFALSGNAMLAPPGPDHWLGADQLGRDLLSRLLYGARISFHVAVLSVGFALGIGTLAGGIAGYVGGWIDQVVSRCVDVLFSIPDILLALAIMAALGPTLNHLVLAIGIVYTPIFARIARGAVLDLRHADYIEAARSIGSSPAAILYRHVLPGILGPLVVQTTLSFAFAILTEAALSFLGLGVEPDQPSWGILLNQGKDLMERAWWIAVFPGLAITLTVFCFNLVGDGLRDALDPRVRAEKRA
ncbi:MAG: ABC transporter permease [Verrucomicrobia bacterium]|nr:ABC transporter permease [Verrucomicrobiota bacterium]